MTSAIAGVPRTGALALVKRAGVGLKEPQGVNEEIGLRSSQATGQARVMGVLATL